MIFAVSCGEKTKPIQSQTKPILVSPQIFWGLKNNMKKQSQFYRTECCVLRIAKRNTKKQSQLLSFSVLRIAEGKKAKMSVNLVFIRTTIFQLLVFFACFLNQSTVTYLYVRCYEVFYKEELLAFCFSP